MPHSASGQSNVKTGDQAMSAEMQECLRNCEECASTCWETIAYCAQQGGKHIEPAHLEALLDCAQICTTTVSLLARASALHPAQCGVCAEACRRCQESCEQFDDDEQMRACAEACARSAKSCEQMASMR